MYTILQRWVNVKHEVIVELNRVQTCIEEAMNMITEKTGQRYLEEISFTQNNIEINLYDHGQGGKVLVYVESLQRGDELKTSQHWSGALCGWEVLARIAKTITTCAVIAAWEKQQ